MVNVVSCLELTIENLKLYRLKTHLSVDKDSIVHVTLVLLCVGDGRNGAATSKFFRAVFFVDFSSVSSSPLDIP
jgi:hypothetical protein